LKWACASLGIVLAYTRPYQAAAKGKIERLWRTLRTQLLPLLKPALGLQELNERLWTWIDSDYHVRIHSSTAQPPLKRYLAHIQAIRPAPTHLSDHFRACVLRTVDKDRTVSLNGRLYEAPVGLIGKSVRLLYHPEDQSRIEVVQDGSSLGFLVPLNPAANSRVRRDKYAGTDIVPPDPAAQQGLDHHTRPARYQGGELFDKPPAEEQP
jgi:hypothetical protein